MIINKPLWGQEMWKNIWALLQEPEADLIVLVFHVPAHRVSPPPGNQEAQVLAKICTLATDLSADMADWLHQRSGHYSDSIAWHIFKEARLPL